MSRIAELFSRIIISHPKPAAGSLTMACDNNIVTFEGVCLTPVILTPGACGREGPSCTLWHLIVGIRGIRGIGEMNSKSRILGVFYGTWWLGWRSGAMFCWLFHTPFRLKPILLIAFLESCFPEMLSKVGVLAERSLKKSTKTSSHSSGGTGRLWRSGSSIF